MDNLDGMQPGEYVDRISHSYIYIYIIRGTMGGGASVDKRRVIKLGGVTTLTNDAGARFTRPLS